MSVTLHQASERAARWRRGAFAVMTAAIVAVSGAVQAHALEQLLRLSLRELLAVRVCERCASAADQLPTLDPHNAHAQGRPHAG